MEKYLIHSNELHLIDAEKIHQAVEKMVESLDLAAGSTTNFDLYQVVENYFKDLEKRRKINHVLGHKIKERNLFNHTRQVYPKTREFHIECNSLVFSE